MEQSYILDACALIAVFTAESGANKVSAVLRQACNLCLLEDFSLLKLDRSLIFDP
jgi:PIN domain nuclease of toxin-antitoxin system